MSYFEDYDYSEPSMLDELVDNTTNKIKNMIIKETKEKVNEILNKATAAENRLNITNNRLREACQEISSLTKENEKLKKELEQKRTSLDTLPFEIGQKVYYLKRWRTDSVVCPLCEGRGKITTHSDEYGDVDIKCPNCKDNSYWSDKEQKVVKKCSYDILTIDDTTIKGITIRIVLNAQGNIEQKVKVSLRDFGYYGLEDVFTEAQLEECRKECAERNKRYKEEAERKVGIIN